MGRTESHHDVAWCDLIRRHVGWLDHNLHSCWVVELLVVRDHRLRVRWLRCIPLWKKTRKDNQHQDQDQKKKWETNGGIEREGEDGREGIERVDQRNSSRELGMDTRQSQPIKNKEKGLMIRGESVREENIIRVSE